MVFGFRKFKGSSPDKQPVDGNTPRKADRVEATEGSATPPSVKETDIGVGEPGDTVIGAGAPTGSSEMNSEPLNVPATSRDSTATRFSTLSAYTSARVSDGTLMPSVSQMLLKGEAREGDDELEHALDNHLVTLNAIPEFVLTEHPELKMVPYDLGRGNILSNAIAMPHNACRLEMSDMWSDILPSLQSRPIEELTREDASDLTSWWGGFARFSLTTSLVDDMVMARALKDIIDDFDRDAQMIKRAVHKFEEKNTVTLEIVCRSMGKAVELFVERMTEDNLEQLVRAWSQFSLTICDIYQLVEKTLNDVDRWRRDDIANHRDLEKKIALVYMNRKRWGNNDAKRGEMIVVLTRWVGSEHIMRDWMQRNLGKKEVRCIARWMDEYRAKRLQLIDSFHQRRAL